MAKETNFQKIKEIACEWAKYPLIETDMSPMIVLHPFITSAIISVKTPEKVNVQVNLLENVEALKTHQARWVAAIENCVDIEYFRSLINRPYRLAFLERVEQFLSNKDYSIFLANAFVSTEHPDQDPNMTKKKLVEMFKKADKSSLMRKEDYEKFCQLAEVVTIYRGVTSKNERNVKAMSWTLDYDVAEWFAKRNGEMGKVYSAKIYKKDIFAYFNLREEAEVVVDPTGLKNIELLSNLKQMETKEK